MKPLSTSQQLALDRLRHGLVKRLGGWQTVHPSVDPEDLIRPYTLNSLVRHGLAEVTDDGTQARPTTARPEVPQ